MAQEAHDSRISELEHELARVSRERDRLLSSGRDMEIALRSILDNLEQGYFIFDSEGICGSIYSTGCLKILGWPPEGRPIWEVLGIDDEARRQDVLSWLRFLFRPDFSMDEVGGLGPQVLKTQPSRYITLQYRRSEDPITGNIEGIVVIATDRTEERENQVRAERERALSQAVLRIVRSRSRFLDLVRETRLFIQVIRSELQQASPGWDVIYRSIHTLKGGVSYFSLAEVARHAHDFESILADGIRGSAELRDGLLDRLVDVEKCFEAFLEEHSSLLGSGLAEASRVAEVRVTELREFEELLRSTGAGSYLADKFHEQFLLEPIANSFEFFNNVIAMEAPKVGKEVRPLSIVGGELRIRTEPFRELISSLIHVFRNAIAHGIEEPADRTMLGKHPAGRIEVTISRTEQKTLRFDIRDDGQGVSPDTIRLLLDRKGDASHRDESDEQVIQRIFLPGLSTAEQVTDLAGRGVGLDAVLSAARNLGGKAWVESTVGIGTSICIEVPEAR